LNVLFTPASMSLPAAMGLYMNQKGVKSVFLIGPNYAAGVWSFCQEVENT
jgi:hypothetical protein